MPHRFGPELGSARRSLRLRHWPRLLCVEPWQWQATVSHQDADYVTFLDLLGTAEARHPIKIFGFCLLPNS